MILLSDEQSVSEERAEKRRHMAEQMWDVPKEFFERVKHLQTEVGCGNTCSMCSQSAAKNVTAMTREGMEDFMAALKHVVDNRPDLVREEGDPKIAWARNGRIVPYLDNDSISSNDLLDRFIEIMKNDFNATVQLSTVGFSRHNEQLTEIHERIANSDLLDGISEFRVSWSHYPTGSDLPAGAEGLNEYFQDMAHMLGIYKPLYERSLQKSHNDDFFRIESRYPPQINEAEVEEGVFDGRHIIKAGPNLLISLDNNGQLPAPSRYGVLEGEEFVDDIHYKNPEAVKTIDHRQYLRITSDEIYNVPLDTIVENIAGALADETLSVDAMVSQLNLEDYASREVRLSQWSNEGGKYYAVDPFRDKEAKYFPLHIYPETETRQSSGYNDASRPIANLWLDFKKERYGAERFEIPREATWDDVADFLDEARARVDEIAKVDSSRAEHVRNNEFALLSTLAMTLSEADYPAHAFFDGALNRLNGQVRNQVLAQYSFKPLAVAENDPMTPKEERGNASNTFAAERSVKWRAAPAPQVPSIGEEGRRVHIGRKNLAAQIESTDREGDVYIHRLIDPYMEPDKDTLVTVGGVDSRRMDLEKMVDDHLIPGSSATRAQRSFVTRVSIGKHSASGIDGP